MKKSHHITTYPLLSYQYAFYCMQHDSRDLNLSLILNYLTVCTFFMTKMKTVINDVFVALAR